MNAITTQYLGDAEQINLQILRQWIAGKGKPLSWDTLIDVLKAIGLGTLASDIQDGLHHSDHSICKSECVASETFYILLTYKVSSQPWNHMLLCCNSRVLVIQ